MMFFLHCSKEVSFVRDNDTIVTGHRLIQIILDTGFFGRNLRRATTNLPCIESSKKSAHALRKWTKRFIRLVYFFNVCLGIIFLTYLTIKQQGGSYRCTKILVEFGDEVWENAYVTTIENGTPERRLLIYSHFNGIYEENGKASRRNGHFVFD